jgi:hypothetical protein
MTGRRTACGKASSYGRCEAGSPLAAGPDVIECRFAGIGEAEFGVCWSTDVSNPNVQ